MVRDDFRWGTCDGIVVHAVHDGNDHVYHKGLVNMRGEDEEREEGTSVGSDSKEIESFTAVMSWSRERMGQYLKPRSFSQYVENATGVCVI